jgi:hypothetical protein
MALIGSVSGALFFVKSARAATAGERPRSAFTLDILQNLLPLRDARDQAHDMAAAGEKSRGDRPGVHARAG